MRTTAENLAFKQGYFVAVATIMRTHDAEVIARDVLSAFGEIDFAGIDTYEVQMLRPLLREIKRRERLERM